MKYWIWLSSLTSIPSVKRILLLKHFGSPEIIWDETVNELRKIFLTGLIISPSHEAILPDIPPENIAALFNTVKLKI